MHEELRKFGKKLVESGLVSSHFGNISIRVGRKMLISRSGAMLDELDETNVVEVDLERPSSLDIIASSEANVHRAIYKNTSALAIIHTHSPFAVVMSLICDARGERRIIPVDTEGSYFLHEIPLVHGGAGTEELAKNLAAALKEHKAAIAVGHGAFCIGKILEEAFVVASMVEHSCKVRYFYDAFPIPDDTTDNLYSCGICKRSPPR